MYPSCCRISSINSITPSCIIRKIQIQYLHKTHRNKALNFSQATIGQCPFFRTCPKLTSRVSLNSVVTRVSTRSYTSDKQIKRSWPVKMYSIDGTSTACRNKQKPKEMVVVGCGSWSMRTNLQKPGNMMKHVCWFPQKNGRFTRDPGTCHGFCDKYHGHSSVLEQLEHEVPRSLPVTFLWSKHEWHSKGYTYRDHLVVILHLILHLPATILSPWERSKLLSLLQGNSTSVAIRCH